MTILPSPIPHPLDLFPWDVPGWVYEGLEWAIGVEWPEGNEQAVWDLADQWFSVAAALAGPRGDAQAAAAEVFAGYGGTGLVGAAFDEAWKKVAEGEDAPLSLVLTLSHDLGKLVEECGCDIEAAKIEVWIEVGLLVAELVALTVAVVLTMGAASPAAAAAISATRFAIQQTFRKLVIQLASKALKKGAKEAAEKVTKEVAERGLKNFARRAGREGLEEAAEEVSIDLGTQLYQNTTGRRDGLDASSLGTSAVGGLAGGAGAGLADLGRHASGKGLRFAENVGREMGGEVLGETAASLATGGGLPDLEEAARAASSGARSSTTTQSTHLVDVGRLDALSGTSPPPPPPYGPAAPGAASAAAPGGMAPASLTPDASPVRDAPPSAAPAAAGDSRSPAVEVAPVRVADSAATGNRPGADRIDLATVAAAADPLATAGVAPPGTGGAELRAGAAAPGTGATVSPPVASAATPTSALPAPGAGPTASSPVAAAAAPASAMPATAPAATAASPGIGGSAPTTVPPRSAAGLAPVPPMGGPPASAPATPTAALAGPSAVPSSPSASHLTAIPVAGHAGRASTPTGHQAPASPALGAYPAPAAPQQRPAGLTPADMLRDPTPEDLEALGVGQVTFADLGVDPSTLTRAEVERYSVALSRTALVDPHQIRFTQRSVSPRTSDGVTAADLAEAMRVGGWRGGPVHGVRWGDGSFSSLDNRRLRAARRAGLATVPLVVHAPSDRLADWPHEWTPRRRRTNALKVEIRELDDGQWVIGGDEGRVVYAKGTVPRTYGDMALFRAAEQRSLLPGQLFGADREPVLLARPPDPLRGVELSETEQQVLDDLRSQAAAAADRVEADLADVARAATAELGLTSGIELRGQENRIKSADSLARKYVDQATAQGKDATRFARDVTDVLRFSMVLPAGKQYRPTLQRVMATLEDRGYRVDPASQKNFWSAGNRYYGFNCTVTAPGGQRFELQLPTEASWRAGSLTRESNEILRREDELAPRRVHALLQMLHVNKQLSMADTAPEDVGSVAPLKDSSFAKWICDNGGAWYAYQAWLDLNDRRFSEIVAEFGLDASDFPVSAEVADELREENVHLLLDLPGRQTDYARWPLRDGGQ